MTRKKIETSRFINRVYHFLHEQVFHTTVVSPKLLHQCLGHTSLSTLGQIKTISFEFFFFSSSIVCSQAKKTRLTFLKSDTITSACFDLIHCDI